MSKYFVTGGSGFLAKHLIPKLQSLGHEVVTDWRYWNDRYEAIIHLASNNNIGTEFNPKLIESNFILANEVFKRPERIIYASSCAAKYNCNPYSMSKIWAEYLGEKHGNSIGLRFHNIYGAGGSRGIVWYLMNQKSGSKITIRGPEIIRDYVAVENVVSEIIRHLKPDGRFFDLRHAREKAKEENRDLPEILNEFIFKGNLEHIDLNATRGVVDVGTGIGHSTLDVVRLYRKLSGKHFELEFAPAGLNEPTSMISNNPLPNCLSLEQGLLKLINNA